MPAKTSLILACLTRQIQSGMTLSREVASAEGLVHFDGVNFIVFNRNNTVEFRDNFVNKLYVDHRGTLWIGTSCG